MVTEQDRKTIGELTTWLSGGTPRRSNAAFWQGNIPWISATTLKQAEIYESDQNVTPEAVRAGSKMAPLDSTLLLVRGSSLHKEIRAGLVVAPVCFNQDVKALVPGEGVHPKFLTYSLLGRQKELLRLVSTASNSAGVLNTKQVQGLEIFCPLPEEQQAVAKALTDVDRLIASLEGLIKKKRAIKEGAMQQLLTGRTRLTGFKGEWKDESIGELASIVSGGTPSTQVSSFWNGDILWCTPSDITDRPGKYIDSTARRITDAGLTNSSATLLPTGSLLLCSRATIGEVKIATREICTNQGFKSLVCNSKVDNEFLYYKLLTLKDILIAKSIGSTFLELGKRDLAGFRVCIPEKEEQSAIAKVLADMDREIEVLENSFSKYSAITKGMMQQFLTGRIRLASSKAKTSSSSKKQSTRKPHTSEFDEAVVLSVLVNEFGSEKYPLGRFRRMKYAYLLHRHMEGKAEGYVKKAVGPYNPSTRYRGPERIAQQNRYVREASTGKWSGFVPFEKIDQAVGYFDSWYGDAPLEWMKQFRYTTNVELELLTTVDMAIVELNENNAEVSAASVRQVIKDHPEWKAKLDRPLFSDESIARAIEESRILFN